MGYKPRLELPNPNGPGVQNVQMSVPGNKCGLVIGKGMYHGYVRVSKCYHMLFSCNFGVLLNICTNVFFVEIFCIFCGLT